MGGLGRILICIGLLMFAFVAYQLWGTGIQTAQAQRRLENKFEDQLATATTIPLVTVPPTTLPPPTTVPATNPGDTAPPETVPAITNPPVIPTTTLPAAVIEAPENDGDPLARLEIPAIDLDWIVVSGVSRRALQDGPGHFPETPLPGQVGNSAIAGHRTTHGEPFRNIDDLDPGDELILTTLAGRFTYIVTGTEIVLPSEYDKVVPAADATKATVTLVSCHPRGSTSKRIVVHAELDPTRSAQITNASTPRTTEPSELPSEFPDDTTGPGGPGSSDPATTEQGTAGPGTNDPSGTAPGSTGTESGTADGGEESAGAELFESGWFSDSQAWPHVILWGLLLAAITTGAYFVARHFKRTWVGVLVGVVPFVVVLYFWFENVNRLLPPGL